MGLHLGHLLGGTFIIETIFAWPGLGRLVVQAVFDRDFPVLVGATLLIALIYQLLNLAVDLLHAWLDPRVGRRPCKAPMSILEWGTIVGVFQGAHRNATRHDAALRTCAEESAPAAYRARRRSGLLRPHFVIGAILVGTVVLGALLAPVLAPSAPDLVQPSLRLKPPSSAHPFGTDAFGRDQFSPVLYGARLALLSSVLPMLLAAVPGTLLGLIAGYRKGRLEQLLSRLIDVWLAFPGLLLAIVLVARLGPSLNTTVLALGVVGVPWYYRLVRGGTLCECEALYVEAACSLGRAAHASCCGTSCQTWRAASSCCAACG